MHAVTYFAGMSLMGFTFGMVVIYGYTAVTPQHLYLDNTYQAQKIAIPFTEAIMLDHNRDQKGNMRLLNQKETVPEISDIETVGRNIESKTLPKSTFRIYRIQDEIVNVSTTQAPGVKKPYECPTSELGKPNLSFTNCLLEAIHALPDTDLPEDLRIFNPTFSLSIHQELLGLLEVFHREMTSHNLTYFVSGGTLIGSWRHHGFIPWDDDIDVFMDVNDRPKLKSVLENLPAKYGHYTDDNGPRWKLFTAKRHQFENTTLNWASPFVDICFYRRNGTYIRDIDRLFWNSKYNIDDVFPVTTRPFYHLSVMAPKNTEKVIKAEYNVEVCASAWWNHRTRKSMKSKARPCDKLRPYFPFVNHALSKKGPLEFLMIKERVLYLLETKASP